MRKNLLFLIILLCVSTINYGQTLVTPGDGTLTTAINAAADGDVLQLFGGAEYTVTDSSSFAKIIERSLTIEGDPSVTDKPIVKFASSLSEEPKFFLLGNNASFTLRSVIIDGNVNGVSKAANVISFDYNALSNDVSNIKNIRIENCEIKKPLLCQGQKGLFKNGNRVVKDIAQSKVYKHSSLNYKSGLLLFLLLLFYLQYV